MIREPVVSPRSHIVESKSNDVLALRAFDVHG